ncbi:MAG TPA: linear amide C-N hydrolase [Verrucomicrobiae bacterium]|nr:linear amide C-N hydrolase [Verrucomicrobiae bacterium]
MKKLTWILCLLVGGWLACSTASACTTFVMEGGGKIYFGRNLDWDWESGLVFVNQRNISKTAVVAPDGVGAKWTSKYGSVTFNQFGLDVPFGGMNEAGLVVENMWLDETKYPAPDARPGINLAQWIQYQLDNCKTVKEVLATDNKVRLEPLAVPAGIHYLLCDASGDCATVEFLDGKMAVHHGAKLPYHVLANDIYDSSAQFAKEHPGNSDGKPLRNTSSFERFTRASECVADFKPRTSEQDVAYAFNALQQVRQGDSTVWQIVYDVSGRKIHFRTFKNREERVIDFKALDFSCGHPLQFTDIESKPMAKGLEFKTLPVETLQKYLAAFYGQESLKKMFGDLAPMIGIQLNALQNYQCAK